MPNVKKPDIFFIDRTHIIAAGYKRKGKHQIINCLAIYFIKIECKNAKSYSDTGNRTRASWVKARYPSH